MLSMNDLHLASTSAAIPFLESSDEFPLADLELGANLIEAVGAIQKGRQEVRLFFLRLLPLRVPALCTLAGGVVVNVVEVFLTVVAFFWLRGSVRGLFLDRTGAVRCEKFLAADAAAAASG